jgi:hypothetical protein
MPGIDSYTKLLLHCNGSDGSTTFTDSETTPKTVSVVGNTQIDTAQSKFGGASALFDGNGDYLSLLSSSDWSFPGDFTIDFWIRLNARSGYDCFIQSLHPTNGTFQSLINSSNQLYFYADGMIAISSSLSWNLNQWYHIAIVRNGSSVNLYRDGISVASGTNSSTLGSSGYGITIGESPISSAPFDGWMDEIRVSKGIARWTSDFTPSTEEYSEPIETLDLSESISLSDSFITQVNPDNQSISDSLSLSDLFQIQTNPDNQSISDSLSLEDSWNIHISNEELDILETLNLSDDWSILVNPEQQILSETVSLSDNWVLNAFGTYYAKILTDFRWLQTVVANISTSFSWLLAKNISTDFRWLQSVTNSISTDFRWLSVGYAAVLPIALTDIQIFVNGVDLNLGNDVDLYTGNITHTIGQTSIASFTLARRHDDLDRTHLGVVSQITNQNYVQIIIDGHLEFDGYVSAINVNSESETVTVTAKMEQPSDNRHSIELPLPSVNEKLHLYHCLVNNVQIDNPKEDTRAVIISNNRYWNGSTWTFYIEDAMIFTTDIDAQNYIDTYIDLSVNLIFESKQPSVTSREKNPQYYKGIKVNLGTKIQQQVDKYRLLEYITNGKGMYATQIENGTFITKPNYSYFWAVLAKNALTGVYNGDYRYIGTSLASTTTDLWILNGVVPMYQKIKDNIETELGYYYVGSAPYKEISTKNGILLPAQKWQDRDDGLYNVLDASYNYENYAKIVAGLEYEKLKNVHGDILPVTSASIDITFDAYYYYTVKLLTRINVTNTIVANTYNNLNGFPTSVKGININFSTMKITLNTDNRLSQEEIDEIDNQMPDEDNYQVLESAVQVYRKFDLKTWQFVS